MRRKLSKKILLEAARNAEVQNRMQEIAGVKKTGCPTEHLSEENKRVFGENLSNSLQGIGTNQLGLSEKEDQVEISYVCVKDATRTSATACQEGCPPCPEGCECKKITTKVPSPEGRIRIGTGTDNDVPPLREDVVEWEFEGCAQKLVVKWFVYMTWEECPGNKCQDCYDEGCSCVEKIKGGGSVGLTGPSTSL